MYKLINALPDYVKQDYLKIGEGGFYQEPTAVQTVLGSCVSVTFHDPRTKFGAIFHALLPKSANYEVGLNQKTAYRYVDSAIDFLVGNFKTLSIPLGRLEIKLFGGANAISHHSINIGKMNVETAIGTLDRHGLTPSAQNVGGVAGRKILMLTHTGEIYLKHLRRAIPE